MAEQEACAAAVTEALGAAHITAEAEGGASTEARGESLLLPLLQGLLGGGGERLLAGLGAAPADVVSDVRRSLARLRAALAEPAAHPQARALLALADRLEDALDAANRLDGCRRRPRRRPRAARHTVGVTREELDQARRKVDADPLGLHVPDHPTSTSAGSTGTSEGAPTPERKQSVDVDGELGFHAAVESKPKPPPPQHSISYEPPRVSHAAQTVQPEPVERRAPAPRRPDFFRHSVADATLQQPIPLMDRRPLETKSSIAAIANKFDSPSQAARQPTAPPPQRALPAPRVLQEEPTRTFFRPLPPTYNFAAPPPPEEESKPLGRFNGNRKMRMKRANTIDIGRPLAGYRGDSDTDEEPRAPLVPGFTPQTENDRKFVAFMKKNEAGEREGGQANWSNRFGNIKHAFESRERDEHSRSSSASSSARRFWRGAEEPAGAGARSPRGRKMFSGAPSEIVKPPWVTERREPARIPPQPSRPVLPPAPPLTHAPVQMRDPLPYQIPAPPLPRYGAAPAPLPPLPKLVLAPARPPVQRPAAPPAPPPAPLSAPVTYNPPPPTYNPPPALPQSPTRSVSKPFVARPIPVNQFSHAPMSAFKPPAKIASPVNAPPHVWSPPSFGALSPSAERAPAFPSSPRQFPPSPTPPSWAPPVPEPAWSAAPILTKYENGYTNGQLPTQPLPPYERPPTLVPSPPPQTQNYPVTSIPSQNELSAPELVRRMSGEGGARALDAQRLQIEFYERQIREKRRREAREPPPPAPSQPKPKPPPPAGYTITDYTPPGGLSTFMPLQRTPDIEKARAHKVDYLPDVVTNETDRPRTPGAPPAAPEEPTTEHSVAVTRVMRGPVRGAATVTAGVRTRGEPAPADALRGTLDKLSSPRREAQAHADRKKRSAQLRARSPPPPPRAPHAARPSPPSPGPPSRDSGGSSPGATLSRSGSWHQLFPAATHSGSASPRRVVSRAKSMHLLAVPKLFEGGIAREEVSEKRRSVAAYFAGGAPEPAPRRTARRQPFALGRSHTMGALTELQFLDESNADDAFEDLVSALA